MEPNYQCSGCSRIFRWQSDELNTDENPEIKTAVRWCGECVDAEAAAHGISRELVIEIRKIAGRAI
jgi:hypothetical protein